MKKKMDGGFVKRCCRIASLFDCMGKDSEYDKGWVLSDFLDEYPELKSLGIDGMLYDDVTDVFQGHWQVAFGLGFVIGRSVDLTYPEAQADIEAIKHVIRKKGLLPYLPRERRAP